MKSFTSIDTFKIAGRGTVHTIDTGEIEHVKIGETILLDGKESVVKGIELRSRSNWFPYKPDSTEFHVLIS